MPACILSLIFEIAHANTLSSFWIFVCLRRFFIFFVFAFRNIRYIKMYHHNKHNIDRKRLRQRRQRWMQRKCHQLNHQFECAYFVDEFAQTTCPNASPRFFRKRITRKKTKNKMALTTTTTITRTRKWNSRQQRWVLLQITILQVCVCDELSWIVRYSIP